MLAVPPTRCRRGRGEGELAELLSRRPPPPPRSSPPPQPLPEGAWRGSALELAAPTTDPLAVLDLLHTLIVGPNHRAKPVVPTRSANASSNFRGVSSQARDVWGGGGLCVSHSHAAHLTPYPCHPCRHSLQGSRWRARICIDKNEVTIGDFDTEQVRQPSGVGAGRLAGWERRALDPAAPRPAALQAAAVAYDRESISHGKLRTLNFVYQ